MNYIKHSVVKFAKLIKLDSKKITFKNLTVAISKKNFVVRKYSTSEILLVSFDLFDDAANSDSISCIDEYGIKHIFIDDTIPKQKQLFALAHEIGHIVLNHNPNDTKKHRQEREANLFAHYLLDSNYDIKQLKSAIFYTLGIICFCLSVIFICLANEKSMTREDQQENNAEIVSSKSVEASAPVIIVNNINSHNNNNSSKKENNPLPQEQQEIWEEDYIETDTTETQDSTFCYFTQHGEVYHLYEDCSYLTHSNEVYCDTVENCNKNRLCSRCADKYSNNS